MRCTVLWISQLYITCLHNQKDTMGRRVNTFAFVLVFLISLSSAERIMFMPFPIVSHGLLHADLARAMVEKKYDVTLVLPVLVTQSQGVNLTGLHVIEYHTTHTVETLTKELFIQPLFAGEAFNMDAAMTSFRAIADETLGNQGLFEQMKASEPDLFVIDDCSAIAQMFAVFPYRLGIPFASLDFAFQPYHRRVPFSPAVTPAFMSCFDQRMTLGERLQNTLLYLRDLVFQNPLLYEDAVARFAPEMPYISLNTLASRAEIWLIFSDPILQIPYPTLPNIKFIGGIAAMPAKPLDSKFQSFMDSAKDGVTVVSFGGTIDNIPKELYDKLMEAFRRLRPMKFVVRSNETSPDPDHILTAQWILQNSLLAHPNCRVLVTHCGLNSMYQALYHAVPMLGLPLFYDQFCNANLVKSKGFAITHDARQVTVEEIVDGVRELLTPQYRQPIHRASRMFRSQLGVPLQTAAFWLDQVAEFGGDDMRSAGQQMELYQFLLLDVLAIGAGCATLVLGLLCCCLRCLLTRGRAAKNKKD